jgi:hypothetical protein
MIRTVFNSGGQVTLNPLGFRPPLPAPNFVSRDIIRNQARLRFPAFHGLGLIAEAANCLRGFGRVPGEFGVPVTYNTQGQPVSGSQSVPVSVPSTSISTTTLAVAQSAPAPDRLSLVQTIMQEPEVTDPSTGIVYRGGIPVRTASGVNIAPPVSVVYQGGGPINTQRQTLPATSISSPSLVVAQSPPAADRVSIATTINNASTPPLSASQQAYLNAMAAKTAALTAPAGSPQALIQNILQEPEVTDPSTGIVYRGGIPVRTATGINIAPPVAVTYQNGSPINTQRQAVPSVTISAPSIANAQSPPAPDRVSIATTINNAAQRQTSAAATLPGFQLTLNDTPEMQQAVDQYGIGTVPPPVVIAPPPIAAGQQNLLTPDVSYWQERALLAEQEASAALEAQAALDAQQAMLTPSQTTGELLGPPASLAPVQDTPAGQIVGDNSTLYIVLALGALAYFMSES